MAGIELQAPRETPADSAVRLVRAIGASVPVAATFASMIRTNQEIEEGFFLEEVARRINALGKRL